VWVAAAGHVSRATPHRDMNLAPGFYSVDCCQDTHDIVMHREEDIVLRSSRIEGTDQLLYGVIE
jgi:hypothetical protein